MSGCEHCEIKFALHNTHVTPHPPLSRSPFCPSLGDADRVCSANRSIPHWRRLIVTSRQRTYSTHARQPFYAGVQTMRARICSAFSCDMFARVVWVRLRRGVKLPILVFYHLPHALATHYFLRLTRARGGCFFKRGELTNARSALVGVAETGGKSPLK